MEPFLEKIRLAYFLSLHRRRHGMPSTHSLNLWNITLGREPRVAGAHENPAHHDASFEHAIAVVASLAGRTRGRAAETDEIYVKEALIELAGVSHFGRAP